MTDPPPPGTGIHLDFMGPLSAARAARFVERLAAGNPSTVVAPRSPPGSTGGTTGTCAAPAACSASPT